MTEQNPGITPPPWSAAQPAQSAAPAQAPAAPAQVGVQETHINEKAIPHEAQHTTLPFQFSPVGTKLPPPILACGPEPNMTSFVSIAVTTPFDPAKTPYPDALTQRGLNLSDFQVILDHAQKIRSKSQANKTGLFIGCGFCLGVLGCLLVCLHVLGNVPLRDQLNNWLQTEVNPVLKNSGKPIRFAYQNNALIAYYA